MAEIDRIRVRTKPNCKNCLGTGLALMIRGGESVCSCVTEQLTIVYVDKDYQKYPRSEDRYTPGSANFVKE